MSKQVLVAGLGDPLFEIKTATLPPPLQRPAGQNASHSCDVFLAIAAMTPQRVKFHQLAAIILIQAVAPPLGLFCRCRTLWSRRPAPVVIVVAFRNAVGEIRIRPHAEPVV